MDASPNQKDAEEATPDGPGGSGPSDSFEAEVAPNRLATEMAHYRITEEKSGVGVEVTEVGDSAEKLLQAIGACQEGRCSCPTDEYQKLASLDIDQSADGIRLRLEAKPGETFGTSEIAACLDHTINRLDE